MLYYFSGRGGKNHGGDNPAGFRGFGLRRNYKGDNPSRRKIEHKEQASRPHHRCFGGIRFEDEAGRISARKRPKTFRVGGLVSSPLPIFGRRFGRRRKSRVFLACERKYSPEWKTNRTHSDGVRLRKCHSIFGRQTRYRLNAFLRRALAGGS